MKQYFMARSLVVPQLFGQLPDQLFGRLSSQFLVRRLGYMILMLSVLAALVSEARAETFEAYIDAMQAQARARGVAEQHLAALDTISLNPTVQRLAARQPEYIKPIWEYLDMLVTPKRIADGRAKLAEHAATFDRLEKKFGVPRSIMAAIWGVETNFGTITGDFPVLEALATLGYEGRRQKFGRQQLQAALDILQAGDVDLQNFKGSWAGAMGHTQFIPTTYQAYAVDATTDGRRDIWGTIDDALGSTGNYLSVSGWVTGVPWGVRVRLPEGFDFSQAQIANRRPIADWIAQGVTGVDEQLQARWGAGAIYLPAGHRGPAFLATQNFFALLRYNTAPAYALAVGMLSSRLEGGDALRLAWPTEDRPLLPDEIRKLQALLQKAGYAIEHVDGVPGRETFAALIAFQRDNKMIVDGYATPQILAHIEKIMRQ